MDTKCIKKPIQWGEQIQRAHSVVCSPSSVPFVFPSSYMFDIWRKNSFHYFKISTLRALSCGPPHPPRVFLHFMVGRMDCQTGFSASNQLEVYMTVGTLVLCAVATQFVIIKRRDYFSNFATVAGYVKWPRNRL